MKRSPILDVRIGFAVALFVVALIPGAHADDDMCRGGQGKVGMADEKVSDGLGRPVRPDFIDSNVPSDGLPCALKIYGNGKSGAQVTKHHVLLASEGHAPQDWPAQPFEWPSELVDIGVDPSLMGRAASGLAIKRFEMRKGQLFSVGIFGGLLFEKRADLDSFLASPHFVGAGVHVIQPSRPLIAEETFFSQSVGGKVFDAECGHCFLLMPINNDHYLDVLDGTHIERNVSYNVFIRKSSSPRHANPVFGGRSAARLRLESDF